MEAAILLIGLLFLATFGFALIGVPVLFSKHRDLTERLKKVQTELAELKQQQSASASAKKSAAIQPQSQEKPDPVADPLGLFSPTPGDFSVDVKKGSNPWQGSSVSKPAEPEQRALDSLASERSMSEIEDAKESADEHEELAKAAQAPEPIPAMAKAMPQQPEQIETPKAAAKTDTLSQKLVRKVLAMNITAQVGAVVLIFGAIFLGKYASDIGILTLNAKLALMALASIALATVGVVYYQKLKVFGEILQGTGFAGWLVTLFIAHVLNQQFHWLLVLLLGVAAVVALSYRAWRQNSQALAILGYFGGFVTPFIAASDVSSLWRLFAYISLLNVGVLLVAMHKPWRWLMREAYVGSFLLLGLLMLAETLQRDLTNLAVQLPMAAFAIISLVIFSLVACAWIRQKQLVFTKNLSGLLFAAPTAVAVYLPVIFANESLYSAISFFIIAAWFALLAALMKSKNYIALAILFASAAIPFALNDGLTSLVYSLEGAAFVYWGLQHNKRASYLFGWLVQAAAAAFAFRLFQDATLRLEALNLSWALYGAVVLAGFASAWFIKAKGSPFNASELWQQRLALAWSLAWLIYQFGFWLAESFNREWTLLLLSYVLAAVFAVVQASQLKLRWQALAEFIAPLFSGFLALLLVYLIDYADTARLAVTGFNSILLLGLFVLRCALAKVYQRLQNWDALVTWFATPLLLSILFSALIKTDSDWPFILATVPWLMLVALLPRLQPLLFAANAVRKGARQFSLIILVALTFFSFLGIGNFAPLAFWPLVNPLALLAVVSCVLLYRWWHRKKELRIGILIAGGIAFTCEINRILFHYFGVAYNPDAWLDSALTQTVWSLVWVSIGGALMFSAARIRNCRSHWFTGATLLAIVVLKLFILDFANIDTLFRIFSFIGVGVLLLAIGYVAPLPDSEVKGGSEG